MKKVLLDSSFILTCVKQKIDFFEDLTLMGLKIIIPKQIIREIEGVATSKQKLRFREDAKLALILISKQRFENPDIGRGHVDKRIIEYVRDDKTICVATLDKELKEKLPNSVIVIRGMKILEIQ